MSSEPTPSSSTATRDQAEVLRLLREALWGIYPNGPIDASRRDRALLLALIYLVERTPE